MTKMIYRCILSFVSERVYETDVRSDRQAHELIDLKSFKEKAKKSFSKTATFHETLRLTH